jgi:hypothetical protein
MGIDIYAKWKGQTREEEQAQITGFSTVHGHVGYLREAYHGEPYATRYLVSEAFASPECEARIPAQTLRKRLPETLKLVERRERDLYQAPPQVIAAVQRSYVDFVEFCEGKERATGEACRIVASY